MGITKVGIIGIGFIGRQHVEAVRRIPSTEIVAICETNPEAAKKIAIELGVANYYTSAEEMLEKHKDLDIVHNCTPSKYHYEVNKLIINAGKNVLCEKPFTLTTEESKELVTLSTAQKEVKCGVNFNYRHNLMVIEMKERIQRRQIGTPWFVYAEYLQDWLLEETDYDWRVDASVGGSTRAVSDIGSHCFDTLQYLFDEKIVSVESHFLKKFDFRYPDGEKKPVDNEDAAIILIEFESGLKGLIRVSQVTAGKKNDFHILVEGSENSLEWFQERPDRLWLGNKNSGNQEIFAAKQYLTGSAKAKAVLPNGHAVGWADAFTDGIKGFYDAVRQDTGDYVSFEDADYIMKLVETCEESNTKNKKINL